MPFRRSLSLPLSVTRFRLSIYSARSLSQRNHFFHSFLHLHFACILMLRAAIRLLPQRIRLPTFVRVSKWLQKRRYMTSALEKCVTWSRAVKRAIEWLAARERRLKYAGTKTLLWHYLIALVIRPSKRSNESQQTIKISHGLPVPRKYTLNSY